MLKHQRSVSGKSDFYMRTSDAGRKLLEQREGCRLHAYRDSVGVWTIGYGHTAGAGSPRPIAGMMCTAPEADSMLSTDLLAYEGTVNHVVSVPLTQNQFDACVSLCFNIGQRGFGHSTVVSRLNRMDYQGAANAFLMWDHPSELLGRRKSERDQFLATSGSWILPDILDVDR